MTLKVDKTNWTPVTLGEVVRNVNVSIKNPAEAGIERTISLEHLDPGEYRVTRWGTLEDNISFTRRVLPGQTLFGKRRAYLRKVALADFEAVCTGDILVFEPKDERLLPEFLPFLVSSEDFFDTALRTSAGSMSPRTSWKALSAYEFLLPPIQEQQRIGNLLWGITDLVQSLGELKTASLNLFSKTLDKYWNMVGMLTPLEDISRCVTGYTPSRANTDYWNNGTIDFYTPTQIGENGLLPPSQDVAECAVKESKLLAEYSVLMACIGGALGKTAILQGKAITNQQITAITGLKRNDALLVNAFLNHPLGQKQVLELESTTVVRKLNKSDFEQIRIPWPSERNYLSGQACATLSQAKSIDREIVHLRDTFAQAQSIFSGSSDVC